MRTGTVHRWIAVAGADELPEGTVTVVSAGSETVALCRVDGELYAVEDRCTHDDGPLGHGELDGFVLQCPRHGARFDVRDGSVVRMPAVCPVRTFPVRVVDGRVEVGVEVEP